MSNREVNQGSCKGKGWGCPRIILPLQGVLGGAQTQTSTASMSLLSSLPFISPSSLHTLASSSGMKSLERCLGLTPPPSLGLVPGSSPKPTTPLQALWGGREGHGELGQGEWKRADIKMVGSCCFWKVISNDDV